MISSSNFNNSSSCMLLCSCQFIVVIQLKILVKGIFPLSITIDYYQWKLLLLFKSNKNLFILSNNQSYCCERPVDCFPSNSWYYFCKMFVDSLHLAHQHVVELGMPRQGEQHVLYFNIRGYSSQAALYRPNFCQGFCLFSFQPATSLFQEVTGSLYVF